MVQSRRTSLRGSHAAPIAFAASFALHGALFLGFLGLGIRSKPVVTADVVVVFAAGQGAIAPIAAASGAAPSHSVARSRPPSAHAIPDPAEAAPPVLPILKLDGGVRLPQSPHGIASAGGVRVRSDPAPLNRGVASGQLTSESGHASEAEVKEASGATSAPGGARPGANRGVSIAHPAAPTYPPSAIRLRQEGVVEIEVDVRADGEVAEVRIRKSSGHEALDDAALRAARAARFQPALRNEVPVTGRIVIPFHFQLQNR